MHALYTRWQSKMVAQAMQTRRVLLLAGARQCGKTTLARALQTPDTIYRTLDDVALLAAARHDPHGFVQHDNHLLIIDEVQRVPELLLAIKKSVDQNPRPGQYLLTGSANIQSLPQVQESLAGRIRKLRLRTLTQGEMLGKSPDFLTHAFTQNFTASSSSIFRRDDIIEMALRGGFPEVVKLPASARRAWHRDYIEAILARDLQEIARIQHHEAMRELVQILAAWSGKFMDITAMGSNLSIKRPTIESYLNALETLYVVERLKPWSHTDYARAGKRAKLFMTDCGLLGSLLRWRIDDIRFDADRVGKLIETFVFNELATLVDLMPEEYELFHYRDREKREIDFLIERSDGALLGIEVKAGSSVQAASFKHLQWFKQNLARDKPFIGIVLYSGEFSASFGDNMWAVPFGMLWA